MSDTLQLIIVGIVIAAAVVAAIIRATRRRGNPCDRCDTHGNDCPHNPRPR
ncbi:MAG: FeoB-associated Cys-rich membrane protein [Muribaculaceae bacterium]|nr:FeoB-associated Cys-rich membrane protein [Muribaculaceae bacterium]